MAGERLIERLVDKKQRRYSIIEGTAGIYLFREVGGKNDPFFEGEDVYERALTPACASPEGLPKASPGEKPPKREPYHKGKRS